MSVVLEILNQKKEEFRQTVELCEIEIAEIEELLKAKKKTLKRKKENFSEIESAHAKILSEVG